MPNMQWAERIGRRLKLRDLHVLLAAVEAGSMAKAARRLAVSQPVVSQAIADLEHTLGVGYDVETRGPFQETQADMFSPIARDLEPSLSALELRVRAVVEADDTRRLSRDGC